MRVEEVANTFGTHKPIIGMVHFRALPGSPLYDDKAGVAGIIEAAERDLMALQSSGVDAVMFGNENDRPYELTVSPASVAAMSYSIGQLKPFIHVPVGVDVLWDPIATIAVAKAAGCVFAREVFTGVYGGDMGFWNPDCGKAMRFRQSIGAANVVLIYNINAEFAERLAQRSIQDTARSVLLSSLPDVIAVSGGITGGHVKGDVLRAAKEALPDVPIFANTGVTMETAREILEIADGAVVGTGFKRDGITWNEVDPSRVARFMEGVTQLRGPVRPQAPE